MEMSTHHQKRSQNFDEEKENDNGIVVAIKKKRISAIVQVANCFPVVVTLSQNCSTVGEHAAFLLDKLNKTKGNVFGLRLSGPISLLAIFSDNSNLLDHDEALDPRLNYTFFFKASDGPQAKTNNQMVQMAKEKEALKKLVEKQDLTIVEQANKLEEFKQKFQEKEKEAMKLRDEERANKVQKEQLKERRMAPIVEFAHMIGKPIVTYLAPYSMDKLLQLIEHGNSITSRLYIQRQLALDEADLLQNIVDLMATAYKPEKMIKEVIIECGHESNFDMPEREEDLILKKETPCLDVKFNEECGSPGKTGNLDYFLAEYELVNKHCRFIVHIHYCFSGNSKTRRTKYAHKLSYSLLSEWE